MKVQKNKNGFTLIELVVVIVILGVLAVTVAPRFVDISDNARVATVRATAAAFKSAVNLSHYKWIAIGAPKDIDSRNDIDIGNGVTVDIGANGWPVQSYSGSDSVLSADSFHDCLSLFNAIMYDGASKTAATTNVSPPPEFSEYKVEAGGQKCTYTLTEDETLGFVYDTLNGEVDLI